VPQPQLTDQLPLDTDAATATVAMETPRSTARELIHHSTSIVDISTVTMPAHFTTGMALASLFRIELKCVTQRQPGFSLRDVHSVF